jgi:hypothetical protein
VSVGTFSTNGMYFSCLLYTYTLTDTHTPWFSLLWFVHCLTVSLGTVSRSCTHYAVYTHAHTHTLSLYYVLPVLLNFINRVSCHSGSIFFLKAKLLAKYKKAFYVETENHSVRNLFVTKIKTTVAVLLGALILIDSKVRLKKKIFSIALTHTHCHISVWRICEQSGV